MRHRLVLSALAATFALGGAASAQSPSANPGVVPSPVAGDAVLTEALVAVTEGMDAVEADPEAALASCRDAWSAVQRAATAGVAAPAVAPVESLVRTCLDTLYGVRGLEARPVQAFTDLQPRDLALDGRGAAFVLDGTTGSVWRTELDAGRTRRIVEPGDGSGAGIGNARKLSFADGSLVILDSRDRLWRWRGSADLPLRWLRSPKLPGVSDDALAMTTDLVDRRQGLFNAYVVDPATSQVLQLTPELGGPGFADLSGYLVNEADLTAVREIVADQSVYLLTADGLRRYYGGRQQPFALATPPDDADLRPGHEYDDVVLDRNRFLVHDARWDRIIAFDRSGGDYLAQWRSDDPSAPLADVVAIAAAPQSDTVTSLVWVTPTGLSTADIAR